VWCSLLTISGPGGDRQSGKVPNSGAPASATPVREGGVSLIRASAAEFLYEFIAVGGYGLAMEEIADAPAQDKIAISDPERGDILAPPP
jgi:hypothetical protein